MDKIRKTSINYIRQGLYISAALFLLTLLVMQVWFLDLLTPAIVSVAFFFTAVSGFRLLLALAVMFIYYLLDNNDTMLKFFIVFMVFYVASLAHHTVFFSRVSNRS